MSQIYGNGTHDYDTVFKKASKLTDSDTLVGESGGLSSIYKNRGINSTTLLQVQMIDTEHGMLLIDPDKDVEVLNNA